MKIGDLVLEGEGVISGLVSVYNTGAKLPITLIKGQKKGPTVLITAGIHCAEYVGIQSVIELSRELDPALISGSVILINSVNYEGFMEGRLDSKVPQDEKNLNRVFPGSKDGTISEQIANFLVCEAQQKADYYIDCHGGNGNEELYPYVYYVTKTSDEVREESKRMASYVDVKYVVGSKVSSGGSYNYAGSKGIPSVLLERGGRGIWNTDEVERYKKDLKNVLRGIGVLCDQEEVLTYEQVMIRGVYDITAKECGLWYPRHKSGSKVKKGDLAGELRDVFGQLLDTLMFEEDGVILYQLSSLSTKVGDELVVFGQI